AAQCLGQFQQTHLVLDHFLLHIHLTFSCPGNPDQFIENVRSSNDHRSLVHRKTNTAALGSLNAANLRAFSSRCCRPSTLCLGSQRTYVNRFRQSCDHSNRVTILRSNSTSVSLTRA